MSPYQAVYLPYMGWGYKGFRSHVLPDEKKGESQAAIHARLRDDEDNITKGGEYD